MATRPESKVRRLHRSTVEGGQYEAWRAVPSDDPAVYKKSTVYNGRNSAYKSASKRDYANKYALPYTQGDMKSTPTPPYKPPVGSKPNPARYTVGRSSIDENRTAISDAFRRANNTVKTGTSESIKRKTKTGR